MPKPEHERARALRTAAKQALMRRDFQYALQLLDNAVCLQPKSYKLHRLRSVAAACSGDYESALEDAETVIELMPNLIDGYYHKGFALYQLHDYVEAAHAFTEGLKLCPSDKVLRQGFWDALTLLRDVPNLPIMEKSGTQSSVQQQSPGRRTGVLGIGDLLAMADD